MRGACFRVCWHVATAGISYHCIFCCGSIGLLVDFLMHILLRYYETPGATRDAKVVGTLETIGASMMLGGFTTWLGVIPLALSTTSVFMTICKCWHTASLYTTVHCCPQLTLHCTLARLLQLLRSWRWYR